MRTFCLSLVRSICSCIIGSLCMYVYMYIYICTHSIFRPFFALGGYLYNNSKYVHWCKYAGWEGMYKNNFVCMVYLCMVIRMYNNIFVMIIVYMLCCCYTLKLLIPFLESWKLVVKYWLTLIFLWIKHNEEASVNKTEEEDGRSSKDMHAVPIFPN